MDHHDPQKQLGADLLLILTIYVTVIVLSFFCYGVGSYIWSPVANIYHTLRPQRIFNSRNTRRDNFAGDIYLSEQCDLERDAEIVRAHRKKHLGSNGESTQFSVIYGPSRLELQVEVDELSEVVFPKDWEKEYLEMSRDKIIELDGYREHCASGKQDIPPFEFEDYSENQTVLCPLPQTSFYYDSVNGAEVEKGDLARAQ